jgi:hypothetical protein
MRVGRAQLRQHLLEARLAPYRIEHRVETYIGELLWKKQDWGSRAGPPKPPVFASVLKSKPAFPDRLCVRPTSLSRAERLLRFGHDDAHAILFPHRASADAPAEILAV